ncbi:MAG: biotin/lipoyl-containing protein, partial [Candidatus Latescibacterota bacterium]
MADFKLPDLGENIESGEVINVLVSEGDSLSEDQPVVELETDKAVIEVPSSVSGTVTKVMISKGDQAKVGQVLLVVDGDGASSTVAAPAEPEPEPEVVAAPAPEPAAVEAPAG